MDKTIDIVIVNWNSGYLLKDCVDSILNNNNESFVNKLFIIDNFSSDGSLDKVVVHEKIQIIQNQNNLGFAAACNQGFRQCNAPYILLLNPDTRLLPDTLSKSYELMEHQMDVSIMGCQLLHENNHIAISCSRFPTPLRFLFDATGLSLLFPKIFTPALIMTDWDHRFSRYVDQVMGAFMLIRKETFEKIGFFDERFFVYYEELDFSRRLYLSGGKTYFNSEIQTYHIGKGTTASVTDYRLYLSLTSRMEYTRKHFTVLGHIVAWMATFIIEPITRTAYYGLRGHFREVGNIWKGYAMFMSGKSKSKAT